MTDIMKLIERAKEQRDRDAAEHCPAEIIALQDEVIAGLEALEAENLGLRLECQGLKAEVAEVKSFWKEAQLRNRNLLEESNDLAFLADQYKAERDALAAELAGLKSQEPVAWAPEIQPVNCDTCIYHYKDADQKPCNTCIHSGDFGSNFEPRVKKGTP